KYAGQLERKGLPKYTERARIRLAVADTIEREVLPIATERWLERHPMRLRLARRTGSYAVNVKTGRLHPLWEQKAGLSRLCPDDAREEAQRFSRRVQPTLEEWVTRSRQHRLTYAVFTQPNSAPGKL